MSEEQSRPGDDLAQLARDLREVREVLNNVESVALSAVAQSLAQTTEKLMVLTKELQKQQVQPWVNTTDAVERLPMSYTTLINSDAPRHYPSSHPIWNLHELDEWLMSK